MKAFTESTVEAAALAWLESIGWRIAHGPDAAPDMLVAERADYREVVLSDVALEPGFPRIGLIHGRQLVDLLIEHRGDVPPEFRERLGLKPGLVRT